MQEGNEGLKPEELAMFEEDFRSCDKDQSGESFRKEYPLPLASQTNTTLFTFMDTAVNRKNDDLTCGF